MSNIPSSFYSKDLFIEMDCYADDEKAIKYFNEALSNTDYHQSDFRHVFNKSNYRFFLHKKYARKYIPQIPYIQSKFNKLHKKYPCISYVNVNAILTDND